MALAVIVALYVCIGLMSAAGSVTISKRLFSVRAEQRFFAFFLVPIAGFYLAFVAYFGAEDAWRLEAGAVAVFALLGAGGSRVPAVLVVGYALHGPWDLLHELHAHAGVDVASLALTEIPLAYGVFCMTYDWCMAGYFYSRRHQWNAARGRSGRRTHL